MVPNIANIIPIETIIPPAFPKTVFATAVPRYKSSLFIISTIFSCGNTFIIAKLNNAYRTVTPPMPMIIASGKFFFGFFISSATVFRLLHPSYAQSAATIAIANIDITFVLCSIA